jgi:fibronectin type 3 domain-containing protein
VSRLNNVPRNQHLTWTRATLIALCIPIAALVVGCGKRRPPLPPVEAVQQRTELLSGSQQGNEVILSWPAPRRNAPDSSVQSIRRIDVYRMAEKPGSPLGLSEEEFAERSTLIGSVTAEQIQTAGDTLSYHDTLELAGQPTRLRYAVRYVNASGQRAAFSNFLSIEPAAKVARPPVLQASGEVREDAVTITWQAPAANIDNSTPLNILGYNVYRTDESQSDSSQTPLNQSLISGTSFSDKNFEFGKEYRYVVRSVSLGTGGAQVESLNSNALSITPKDTFAPSQPQTPSIAAGSRVGQLAIFFAPNPESDIAGYNIHRSTEESAPKANWLKLNQTLLTKTTYVDERIESGKRYFYYIVAIDNAGNASQPSDVGSEVAP